MNPLPNNLVLTNILYAVCPDAIADILGGKSYPEIKGRVKFYYTTYGGILIEAEIFNLPKKVPEGSPNFFGFHIHENGDCSENFEKTGGHYNPLDRQHPYHAGDMPSLLSSDGYAWSAFYDLSLTIAEIIDKSVVIHDMADDFTSQPAGNSGSKIACGVIRPYHVSSSSI